MKLRLFFYFIFLVVGLISVGFWYRHELPPSLEAPVPVVAETSMEQPALPAPPPSLPKQVLLEVPYISEAPDGNWTGPWINGCEEAAIAMVESFYNGVKTVSTVDARNLMQQLFDEQNKEWGSNANSDAARTAQLVQTLGLFKVAIKEKPTIEDIQKEVHAGRPVISLHRGFDLGNKNIPFLATGSSYHSVVVIGYDDTTREFITNDDGDAKTGRGKRYNYDVFMQSLHDYNYEEKLANGPARVIFTDKP